MKRGVGNRRFGTAFLALALAGIACIACACKRSDAPTFATDAGVAATPIAESPVAAPVGHVADLYVATPNASWSKIQRGVGGALGILPSTLGGMVAALSGIDPGIGPEIDGASPAFGAITMATPEGEASAAMGWALVVKLVDPRKARAVLLEGDTARFSSKELAGMTELVPKGNKPAVTAAIANGGYLIVAKSELDLERIGPYAYRTLPTRPLPEGAFVIDVPGAALKGPIAARLGVAWASFASDMLRQDEKMRASHGGRAPDFADPQAIMASVDGFAKGKLALLGDLDHARVTVDPNDDSVHAVLSLVPAAGDGPAKKAVLAMHPGDGAPLLAAPNSPLTVLIRDDADGRTHDAADVEAAIVRALGPRLSAGDTKKMHTVIADWTHARGDWLTLGLLRLDAVWLKGPTNDPPASARAVRGALELASSSPLKGALHLKDVAFVLPTIAGAGQGEQATLSFGEPSPSRKVSVFWTTNAPDFQAFASEKLANVATPTAGTLGADGAILAAVNALETNVTFAIVAQPPTSAPEKSRGGSTAVVVAWGKKGTDAWGRLDVADVVLRDLLKSQMGL